MIVTYTEQVDKGGYAVAYKAATDTPFYWDIRPAGIVGWSGAVFANNGDSLRSFIADTPIEVHNKIVKYLTELGATLSHVQTVHGIQRLRNAK